MLYQITRLLTNLILHPLFDLFGFSSLGYQLVSFFHCCPSPLPLLSLSPCSSRFSIHSLFKHDRLLRAHGDEVPSHLRQPVDLLQCLPHLGHRQLHLAASVRPTGQAREDQRLDRGHKQPLRVAPG